MSFTWPPALYFLIMLSPIDTSWRLARLYLRITDWSLIPLYFLMVVALYGAFLYAPTEGACRARPPGTEREGIRTREREADGGPDVSDRPAPCQPLPSRRAASAAFFFARRDARRRRRVFWFCGPGARRAAQPRRWGLGCTPGSDRGAGLAPAPAWRSRQGQTNL